LESGYASAGVELQLIVDGSTIASFRFSALSRLSGAVSAGQLFCSVGNVSEMHMDIVSLIISLVSGAVGGNVAGAAMKDKSLGPLLNSLAGILGGGAGAAVLNMLGMAVNEGGLDMQAVLSSVASGGVGGAALLIIVAIIKGMMKKTAA
jgi:uncharacterized membrane protein YeaQ/YmgE (transglycosylase-associated protein family)